jgi:hypothetical protein
VPTNLKGEEKEEEGYKGGLPAIGEGAPRVRHGGCECLLFSSSWGRVPGAEE